jgi:hypothetical protein
MTSYIPQVGHKVLVDFGDLGLRIETIADVATDSSWILLFQGEPGEQRATHDKDGFWHLEESGHRMYLLDPQARPENTGMGFVIHADGLVQEWHVDGGHAPGAPVFFLLAEGGLTGCARQKDGIWTVDGKDQIFFISEKQANQRTGALVDDETETAAILADSNAMEAIAEAEAEPVDPQLLIGKGPHLGDATSHVVNGVSLLYRVYRVETDERGYSYVVLNLLPEVPGHPPYEIVGRDASTGRCVWSDGTEVMFASGKNHELALAATRLDTLRRVLRSKYFHYAATAGRAIPEVDVPNALRNEYAEMLFLVETGLRYDQTWEEGQFEEFYENLHDEYLASLEV